MAEEIIVKSKPKYNVYGELIKGSQEDKVLYGIVQHLSGSSLLDGEDIKGESNKLQVFLPSGTRIDDQQELTIRGKEYYVVYTPWDWGAHRNPALKRHNPSLRVIVERKEG